MHTVHSSDLHMMEGMVRDLSDHFSSTTRYMHGLVFIGGAVTNAENIASLPPYSYIETFCEDSIWHYEHMYSILHMPHHSQYSLFC